MSLCPICQVPLIREKTSASTIEFRCYSDIENHFYCTRQSSKDDKLLKQKIRFKEAGHNLVIVLDYERTACEVWRDDDKQKISVPGLFQIDLLDMNKIKQKIKTYLLFG